MKCVFCGCTERRACAVKIADQPPSIREHIRAAFPGLTDQNETGCAWLSTDPPVCSAPPCVKKWNTERRAVPTHSLTPDSP